MQNYDKYKISDLTPIHEFPYGNSNGFVGYNRFVEDLLAEIDSLRTEIAAKDVAINELKNKFNSALNALRAEYMAKIEDLKSKIEEN